MNERIAELEARANNRAQYLLAVEASKSGRKSADITEQEKVAMFNRVFAELIVQEGCQKLEDDGMVEVAIELKQHFGFE